MNYTMASCSFGKDSLAMLLRLIEENRPLDEVVFYDTGMEFQAIYNMRDKLLPLLKQKNIKYTELKPERPFLYDMLEKPVESKQKGMHNGYGWCGGVCRWGTTAKQKALDEYATQKRATVYIGIAKDETKRLIKKIEPYKKHPLVDWGMKEKDCLQYCIEKGYCWDENGVELYSILDRVSCWCCCNKNKKELYNIWLHLPQYWERLKELQSKLDRPMKQFCNKKYGHYGNVFDKKKAFLDMFIQQKRFDTNRRRTDNG